MTTFVHMASIFLYLVACGCVALDDSFKSLVRLHEWKYFHPLLQRSTELDKWLSGYDDI